MSFFKKLVLFAVLSLSSCVFPKLTEARKVRTYRQITHWQRPKKIILYRERKKEGEKRTFNRVLISVIGIVISVFTLGAIAHLYNTTYTDRLTPEELADRKEKELLARETARLLREHGALRKEITEYHRKYETLIKSSREGFLPQLFQELSDLPKALRWEKEWSELEKRVKTFNSEAEKYKCSYLQIRIYYPEHLRN